jgi:hypothetical protein
VEIVAAQVEMLSGRRKRDYAQESAAESLVARATRFGVGPSDPGAALADAGDETPPEAADDEAEPVAAPDVAPSPARRRPRSTPQPSTPGS